MAQRTAITSALTTCGFSVAAERNFIMVNEGLDRWLSFTMINYDDLANIVKMHPVTLLLSQSGFSI